MASPVAEERAWALQYREMVQLTSDWGGKRLICLPGWTIFGTSAQQGWDWAREALIEIATFADDFGVEIIIEPTPEDSNIVNTSRRHHPHDAGTGKKNVKTMFDTHHVIARAR